MKALTAILVLVFSISCGRKKSADSKTDDSSIDKIQGIWHKENTTYLKISRDKIFILIRCTSVDHFSTGSANINLSANRLFIQNEIQVRADSSFNGCPSAELPKGESKYSFEDEELILTGSSELRLQPVSEDEKKSIEKYLGNPSRKTTANTDNFTPGDFYSLCMNRELEEDKKATIRRIIKQNIDESFDIGDEANCRESEKTLSKRKEILATWANLKNVEPLLVFKNATSVGIWNNDLTEKELAPIAKMTQLKRLNIGLNDIVDLTVLKELKNLEYLELLGNKVVSLAPLAELAKMKELHVIDDFWRKNPIEKSNAACPTGTANEALNKFCEAYLK